MLRRITTLISAALVVLVWPGGAHAAPGDPDRAFGRDGVVTHDFGSYTEITGVATQKDGRIVVAGTTLRADPEDHNLRVLVARFRPGGELDRSFADGGKRIVNLPENRDAADGLVITPGGRIAVGIGTGSNDHYGDEYYRAGVLQLDRDGSLDRDFGDTGLALQGAGIPSELERAADGDLVLASTSAEDEDCCTARVLRFDADGSPDRRFSRSTGVTGGTDPGHTAAGRAGLVLDGRRTYLIGSYFDGPIRVVAFDRRGKRVSGFSGGDCQNGTACFNFGGGRATAVSAVVGASRELTIALSVGGQNAGALRLLPSGEPDESFGEDGRSSASAGPGPLYATGIVRLNGRLIISGGGAAAFTRAIDGAGETDPDWGSSGFTRALAGRRPDVTDSAVAGGDLLVAGSARASSGGRREALLIRYEGGRP